MCWLNTSERYGTSHSNEYTERRTLSAFCIAHCHRPATLVTIEALAVIQSGRACRGLPAALLDIGPVGSLRSICVHLSETQLKWPARANVCGPDDVHDTRQAERGQYDHSLVSGLSGVSVIRICNEFHPLITAAIEGHVVDRIPRTTTEHTLHGIRTIIHIAPAILSIHPQILSEEKQSQ